MSTVVDLDYVAISLDTSIVVANGYGFDRPPLNLLSQFKGKPVGVVVSDVIQREVCSQLVDKIEAARAGIQSSLRDASRSNLASDLGFDIREVAGFDTNAVALAKWDRFKNEIGAHVLSSSGVDSSIVLDMYFNGRAPFAPGKKKGEFPDAIALMALEGYAREKGGKVLLVSTDGDWMSFAEKSEFLDCTDDLTSAISKFVPQTAAFEFCLNLANGVNSSFHQHFLELVRDVATRRFADGDYVEDVDAHSAWAWEYDSGHAELVDLNSPDRVGGFDVSLTEISKDGCSFSMKAVASIRFCAEFSISAFDSIDRDYVGLGSATAEEDVDVDVEFFVSLIFEKDGDAVKPYIDDVEMKISPFFIDFGEIEPSRDEWD